jgi:diguanylate cyclase (GGDEF)-like protein
MDEIEIEFGRGSGGFWQRLGRPAGLVAQTRWLFLMATIAGWAIEVPTEFVHAHLATAVLAAMSDAVLLATWLRMYRTGQALLVFDLAYACALTGFALTAPAPALIFGFAFASLFLRSVFGSTRRVILFSALSATAGITAGLMWGLFPGHSDTPQLASMIIPLPVFFLLTGIFRYQALSLFAREQSMGRDDALSELGSRLLGVTDREEIYRYSHATLAAICEITPGLCVLVAFWDGTAMQVVSHAGSFPQPPATVTFRATPAAVPAHRFTVLRHCTELSAAAGFIADWVAVPLPEQADGWLLIGAPQRISSDVVVASRSLTNQVALAVRNSDYHHALDTQANTDSLTGLMNRAAFSTAVELGLVTQPDRVTLLYIDLDDFKNVNDGLGHAAGDELLRHVADRMREAVRAGDYCARIGGDEFAVLLQDSRDDGVAYAPDVIAQRLIDLISAPIVLGSSVVQVGASVGVAHSLPGIPMEQLLQRADVAMYAAKTAGKNRFQVFEPSLLRTGP